MFDGNRRGKFNAYVDQMEDSKWVNVVLAVFFMFALVGALVYAVQR